MTVHEPGAGTTSWRATGFARNGEVAIAYEVLGEGGPWLVLVHGLGYGRWGWGSFAERLSAGRRVVLVDNRGIGESDSPPGPYSVEEMAGDVEAVIDQLDAAGCDILGASLGGMVVLQMALDRPDRLGRIVLVATTPGDELGHPMPDGTARLLSGNLSVTPDTARRLVAGALSPTTLAERPELVDLLLELRRVNPQEPEAWRAQAAASAGFAVRSSLGSIANPVLLIAGTDDTVIDPRNTELLADELADARALLVPDAGHLCFWERPDELASAVAGFLGHVPTGARVAVADEA